MTKKVTMTKPKTRRKGKDTEKTDKVWCRHEYTRKLAALMECSICGAKILVPVKKKDGER